ncbi:hypothetical protein DPEC_G00237850 [Dallia pectoralis]|uniref:Uncharacterized protein n=1 Tax=Dallia pectoralis TaxID=75939 RepID=A0ACC2FZ52_DALPE|nr:hypothetical protein DPEC_G00237850 [Dallia pectoralis]
MLTTRSGDPDDGDNNKDPPEAPELQAAEPDDSTSDSKGPWRIHQHRVTSIWTRSLLHIKLYQILSDKWRLQVRQEQLGLGVLLTDNTTISQEEPGIEPPNFRLIDNRLNPLGGGVTRVVEEYESFDMVHD